jgi:D-lactate dehydrogenase
VDSRGRVIDTSKPLPPDLERVVLDIKRKILSDRPALAVIRKKSGMKTSSGYNIFAFLEHQKPEDIMTHLMVGSAGTLGVVTEIRMELAPLPKSRTSCLAHFKTLQDSCRFVALVKKLGPSAIEILDSFSLDMLREHSNCTMPSMSRAALFIEFDSAFSNKRLRRLLEKYSIEYAIETDPKRQQELWNVRRELLTIVEHRKKDVIAFVEDLGVPPAHLASFIMDLQKIFRSGGVECVIFGHAGEGNLHLRPIIRHDNWKKSVHKIADACYRAAFRYGGTATCEHGMGRNKSPYIRKEWGPVVRYFEMIKNSIDPGNMFNPGINFSDSDITKDMKY